VNLRKKIVSFKCIKLACKRHHIGKAARSAVAYHLITTRPRLKKVAKFLHYCHTRREVCGQKRQLITLEPGKFSHLHTFGWVRRRRKRRSAHLRFFVPRKIFYIRYRGGLSAVYMFAALTIDGAGSVIQAGRATEKQRGKYSKACQVLMVW